MIYRESKRLDEKVALLSEERLLSTSIGIEIGNYINEDKQIPSSSYIELLKNTAKKMNEIDSAYDVDRLLPILQLQEKVEGICKYDGELEFIMNNLYNNAKLFEHEDFNDNEYIKNIKLDDVSNIEYDTYKPYELFIYDNTKRVKDTTIDMPCIGCFDKEVRYPILKLNDKVISSITPYVIETMNKHINNAKGRVLTLGLHMGYFAYMTSIKEDVKAITIVESNNELIEFFKENILPKFAYKDKITIINDEYTNYLNNLNENDYDCCFLNTWNTYYDLEPYFSIKEICRKYSKLKCEYWIEEALASHLMGYVFIEIMENYYIAKNRKIPNYSSEPGYVYRDHEYIRKLLEKAKLSKEDNINYYMSPSTLIKLINSTDIKF